MRRVYRLYYEALAGFRRRAVACVGLAIASGLAEAFGIAALLPLLSGVLDERSDLGKEYFGLRGDDLAIAGVIALVSLGVLSAILRYASDVAVIRLQADLEESLRERMTSALLGMSWPSYLHLSLGETGKSVLLEATQVGVGAQYIVNGTGYAAIACGFIVVAMVINPLMTGATLVFGALMALAYLLAGRRAELSSRHLSAEAAELTETTTDVLGNAKFYRSTGLRAAATQRAASGYTTWRNLVVRTQRWQPLTRLVFDMAGIVFIGLVLGVALVARGDSPLAPLVFLALFYRLAPKLQQAQQGLLGARVQASWWITWRDRHDTAVADTEVTSGSTVPDRPPVVVFDGVSYAFPGHTETVVDGASWTLPPGGCVAIVGESGGGKTTVLDLVTGLLRPTAGTVRLDGVDLHDVDLEAWRHRIGFVIQDAPMFFGTVLDNIAWDGGEPDRERAMRVVELAHLGDVVRGLPEGLDTPIGHRGARLSGGQRQRVALARALYRDPWLLVLDEATSALDSASEREVQDALRSLKGSLSILLVAHRLATVEVADRILVLTKGRVVQDGTWDELTATDGAFRHMATAQGLSGARIAPAKT
jgi:ABC-type multidrug transport system fused ATPase/permease subunit